MGPSHPDGVHELVDHKPQQRDSHSDAEEAKTLLQLDPDEDDLEKQALSPDPSAQAPPVGEGAEYSVSTRTKLILLGTYFALNLSLTIYNKAILGVFPYPWILTSIHATCLCIGCSILRLSGVFTVSELSLGENLTLVAFSLLFTANIAVSNVSLTATYLALSPIILGASLATYGDYNFTLVGFLVTLLGVFLAAIKAIATNRLMVGRLKLPPLELLLRMSPLAAIQSLLYSFFAGEWGSIGQAMGQDSLRSGVLVAVLGNGILAFLLNVTSFKTNRAAGALTMAVAANTKQILTILLGILFFNVTVTIANGAGMAVTLVGVAWYTKAELDSSSKR
ncbi:MAG: hypothetical protein Q9162_002069 [Coniocarpon cinnabarinum]